MVQRLDEVEDLLLRQNQLLERINQLAEWQVRQFIRQWNVEMQRMESECPSTFMLVPSGKTVFNPRKWITSDYKLFVMCQHPSEPHCIQGSQGYHLRQPKKWWIAVSPWLKHLVTFLKYGIPIAGATLHVVFGENIYHLVDRQVELLETMIEDTSEQDERDLTSGAGVEGSYAGSWGQKSSAALRVLHNFLREADPRGYWDGLRRVITEDGNIFWLCEEHARPYRVQPLQIR
jgi:hypothetical protein